jgi:hypothetical protein
MFASCSASVLGGTLPLAVGDLRFSGPLPSAFVIPLATLENYDWCPESTVALFKSGSPKTTLLKQMWDDILLQVNRTLAAAFVVALAVVVALPLSGIPVP